MKLVEATTRGGTGRFIERATTISTLIASLVLVAIASGNYLAAKRPPTQLPEQPIALTGELAGSPNAQIGIVIFSDFECPYCRRFASETLPRLVDQYVAKGLVTISFRHFPLPFHKAAQTAATLADCAGRQGRFWKVHDRLFRLDELNGDTMRREAELEGVNLDTLFACQGSEESKSHIEMDLKDGRELGVTGTPTIFIGWRQPDGTVRARARLVGAKPLGSFQTAIAGLLEDRR